jgi:hypothetical protein
MQNFFENVSVLKLYENDVDNLMEYLMKSKVNGELSLNFIEEDDLYHLTFNRSKVTQTEFEETMKKIKNAWECEINEKTIYKLKNGDRFTRNYQYHNNYIAFSSDTIFQMFESFISQVFGVNLVSHTIEKEFTLTIYRGDTPNDIVSFLSYQELTK